MEYGPKRLTYGRWPRIGRLSVPLWAAYCVLAATGVAGLTVVYLVDPRNPGVYPLCPFFGLTGCYCPGCGTLRALHQFMHGNIAAAFGYNLFAMAALPIVAYSFAAGGLRACGLSAPPPVFIPARWIWALLAAVLAFWLLRNLPLAPFTILAP